ncbi:MAG: hypothetical protein ABI644_05275 [Arenimonas sp.]
MTFNNALLVVSSLSFFFMPSASANSVLSVTEKVAGKSQSVYTKQWWQWVNLVPPGVKPYQDPTGALCGMNQKYDVWFLAGTDGTDDVIRECVVPVGKYLFFPVINMLGHSSPGKTLTCDQAKLEASENNDHLMWAKVEIDGVVVQKIKSHRIRPDICFDAYPIASYLNKPQSYFPAATDGYWLMLKPLSPGSHIINVRARYSNPGSQFGDLEQIFEYRLWIKSKNAESSPPEKQSLINV